MELTVQNPGADVMLASIMDFQKDGMPPFWTAPLYHFYPRLDREYAASLPFPQRTAYIEQILRQVYREQEEEINRKVWQYQAHWESCKKQISDALSDAFSIDCGEICNDMVCRVSMNPIEPRFLRERKFDIFYLNSPQGAIGEAIHEIIHLVWFHVWHLSFGDSYTEYEAPSLKWILSEMVVEPIMRDRRLREINPYFDRGGCVYPYFYTMRIDGRCVLDTLYDWYSHMEIREFMEKSYGWCLEKEGQIRQHIERSEQ